MHVFFSQNKTKIFWLLVFLSVIYLFGHFVYEVQMNGWEVLKSEVQEHFFHILPVTIAFAVFVAADIKERLQVRRREKKSPEI